MQSLLAEKLSFLFSDSLSEELPQVTQEFYEKFITNECIEFVEIGSCETVAALFPKKYTVESLPNSS